MNVLDTCGLPDVVLIVTVPDRGVTLEFAATFNVAVFETDKPDAGLTVTHDTFDDTCHDVFDENAIDVDPAAADGLQLDDTNVRVGVNPISCVTGIRFATIGNTEVVEMEIVAFRDAPVFVAAVNVTTPLPEPEAGLTVSHEPLERACQSVFDVTVTETDDAAFNGSQLDCDTVKIGAMPACDTVTYCRTAKESESA